MNLFAQVLGAMQRIGAMSGASQTLKMVVDASTQMIQSILKIGVVQLSMKQAMMFLTAVADQIRTVLDFVVPNVQQSSMFVFQNVVVVFGAVLMTMNQMFEWADDMIVSPIADVAILQTQIVWQNSNATFNFIRSTTIKGGVIVDSWFGVENWAMWGIQLGRNVDKIVTYTWFNTTVEAWSFTPALAITRSVDVAITGGIVNAHFVQGYADFQTAKKGGEPSNPGLLCGANPMGASAPGGFFAGLTPGFQEKKEKKQSRKDAA